VVTLTDHAATVIRDLVRQHGLSGGTGLRIVADTTRHTLMFSLVTVPAPTDTVVEHGGAVVFLDPAATVILDRKALDAAIGAQGKAQFSIADQPA